MTDFEPKTSQKGSGNTSSRSSKKDNEKGFKKVALKFGLDIDENNRIIDTLLEEFKKTGLSEPHASIYAERQQKEVTVARYITNGLTNKERVISYLKTLKEILTYPSSVLKETDEIKERIDVLTKLLNPTKDDIDPTLSSSYNDSELGMNLLDLDIDCLLVVRVTGNIENNTFDGEEERIDIGGYLWSVQFETQEKKQAFSRKTVKDILNLELDYRNYQYQMLRSEGEMTFEQFLENKHGSSEAQGVGSDTASVKTDDLLEDLRARADEFSNPSSDIAEQQKQDEQQVAATKIQAIQRGRKVRKGKNSALCASGLCQKPGFNDPRCKECKNVPESELAEKQPEMTAKPSNPETGVEAYVRQITEETDVKDPQAAELKQAIASFF